MAVTLVVSLGSLVQMVRTAVPAFKAVREELAATPLTREMRFTITETVVSWNDGTVVALPVRKVRLARPSLVAVRLSEAA
ncbi:MAG: hypothetical protein K2W91_10300 [Novosphingobium sp.]|nr:hypothetical protein [Novosphingobium sp.]